MLLLFHHLGSVRGMLFQQTRIRKLNNEFHCKYFTISINTNDRLGFMDSRNPRDGAAIRMPSRYRD